MGRVDCSILDLSKSRGQRVWLTAYLCPVRHTFDPSNPLRKYDCFEHWGVLDDCLSTGKRAANRYLGSLVTVKMICFRCQHPDWISSPLAETRETKSSAAFDGSWRQVREEYGLGWPVSCSTVSCALRVGRSRNECPNSD